MAQPEAPANLEDPSLPIPERMWGTKDVARFLNITPQHVYWLIKNKGLPCGYVGRYVYHPTQITNWALNEQKN